MVAGVAFLDQSNGNQKPHDRMDMYMVGEVEHNAIITSCKTKSYLSIRYHWGTSTKFYQSKSYLPIRDHLGMVGEVEYERREGSVINGPRASIQRPRSFFYSTDDDG